MSEKNKAKIGQVLTRFAGRYWRVLGTGTLFIVFLEIFEVLHKHEPLTDPFHIVELILYFLFLALIGVLINFLVMINAEQKRTLEILDYKHKTSLELSRLEDWDKLTAEVVKIPGTIADVEASRLHIRDLTSGQMEWVTGWNAEGASGSDFEHDCAKCTEQRGDNEFLFIPCQQAGVGSDKVIHAREYCLPLKYANSTLALIQFKLKAGQELSSEQMELFENIRPEMALALRASQEQKKLAEMKLVEATLAERHSISTYLHDNLSQNLAYLCLKLDQFAAGDEQLSENEWTEIQRMKDAANRSYEIVRGMIETNHTITTPHFVNLIRVYADKVAQRAGIKISVDRIGKRVPIPPEVQQTIFYVFQEALSNVEKHAGADEVKVLVDWGEDSLTVSISDDGIGFDPQDVDRAKHFGLEIMQERMDKVKGRIEFKSSANSGTVVTVCVPIDSLQKERQK